MSDVRTDWIAADWGTSHLRLWAMGADGTVRARAQSDDGMGVLDRDGFEPAFLRLARGWIGAGPVPVIACGMVGSRQGWAEVPYVPVPARPAELTPVPAPARDPAVRVFIVPGLSQDRPADVMRGEETQIAGFLAAEPDFDGVLCLPGTHTKWVRISAGEVVSFQTYMTGELFGLVAGHSVLRHCVSGDGTDEAAFAEAVDEGMARPERLAQGLFRLRAESVLHGLPGPAARSRLSGLMIGAELAAARPYWLGQDVRIAGASGISAAYGRALSAQGAAAPVMDADPLTLAGLSRAYLALGETTA